MQKKSQTSSDFEFQAICKSHRNHTTGIWNIQYILTQQQWLLVYTEVLYKHYSTILPNDTTMYTTLPYKGLFSLSENFPKL